MAPRAYWKGYLKLSLVSCPIALYPASSSAFTRGASTATNHQSDGRSAGKHRRRGPKEAGRRQHPQTRHCQKADATRGSPVICARCGFRGWL